MFSFCSSKVGFLQHFPYKTQWKFGGNQWSQSGETLGFAFQVGPVWIDYVAEITEFKKNKLFIDVMKVGPYKYFIHEHHFEQRNNGTVYRDVIKFSLGFSPIIDWIIGLPATAMTFKKRHALMKKALDY